MKFTPVNLALLILGIAAYLVLGVVVLSSGLVAPLWAVIVYVVLWIAGAVVAVRSARRLPWLPLVLAVGGFGFWLLTLALGEGLLGWTA